MIYFSKKKKRIRKFKELIEALVSSPKLNYLICTVPVKIEKLFITLKLYNIIEHIV